MSTAIAKNFQIGADSTPSNNFTLYQPASPDGTLRLGNGNTGITSSLLTLNSAGQLSLVAGSAAAPTLSPSGDSNTGIFFPAADTIAFAEGGTESMRLDSSGNLGLGVTPSAWWDTSKAIQFGSGASVNGRTNNAAFAEIGANVFLNSSATATYIGSAAASRYQQSGGGHFWFTAPSGTAGNAISFTQAMTLTSAGKLLVGWTTAPSADSQLFANAVQCTNTSGGGGFLNIASSGGGQQFFTHTGVPGSESYTERARITSGGNFLIGTSSTPGTSTSLVVSSSSFPSTGDILANFSAGTTSPWSERYVLLSQLYTGSGFDSPMLAFRSNANGSNQSAFGTIRTAADGSLIFSNIGATNSAISAASEKARITSGGDFLIGKTTGSDTVIGFGVGASGSFGSTMAASTNSTATAAVYSTGASNYRFYVGMGGTVYATSTSISAISDATLKENVRDLETGLSEVMALRPRRFDWKNGDAQNVAGFVAQEVEQVLPELVTDYVYNKDENGNDIIKKSLKMGDILPTLVKAIQEQQAIINQLKARLDAANL